MNPRLSQQQQAISQNYGTFSLNSPSASSPRRPNPSLLQRHYELREIHQQLCEQRALAKRTVCEHIYQEDREKEYLKREIEILQKEITALKNELKVLEKSTPKSPTDHMHTEECQLETELEGEIRAGTFSALVEALYSAKTQQVNDYQRIFVLTYRGFAEPRKVFHELIKNFDKYDENSMEKLRIGGFLKKWTSDHWHDFEEDSQLLREYTEFVERISSKGKLGPSLRLTLEQKRNSQGPKRTVVFNEAPPTSVLPNKMIKSILDISPVEIARQMTIVEYNTIKLIEPKECLRTAWTKKDKEIKSKNLLEMIKLFNTTSRWIACIICSEMKLSSRVAIITHLIDVMKALRELNNFNGVFEILSGIGNSSVHRMHKTFKSLKSGAARYLEEMRNLTNPQKSWVSYRGVLHSSNPPCVPFVGVYQTDLTFIEDGNPDVYASGLINFKKCRLNSSVITEIRQYQQQPYNLKHAPVVADFLKHQMNNSQLSEKALYDLSLQAEPRAN